MTARAAAEADALALLTGPGARAALEAALSTSDVTLRRHELHLVEHRPGDGVTAGYRVWVQPAGDPVAVVVEDYVLLSSTAGRDVGSEPTALARLEGPGGRLLAWRHPHDPALPALEAACDPVLLEDVLPGAGPVTELELVAYRPLRRAVVRARRGEHTSFVKVLRPGSGPGRWSDVVDRHQRCARAGLPVARVDGTRPDGLVVMAAVDGVPLLAAVVEDDAAGVGLDALTAQLDHLPADLTALRRRAPWSERAAHYAAALRAAGAHAERAEALSRAVLERSRTADLGPVVPTHGDFHEGQLTVARAGRGWHVVGVLDVDTAGPGHRVDDLACLLAHAVALGPAGAAVLARWEGAARTQVDPRALAARTAGVLLSLAAGATRRPGPVTVDALLAAAEERVECAGRL